MEETGIPPETTDASSAVTDTETANIAVKAT